MKKFILPQRNKNVIQYECSVSKENVEKCYQFAEDLYNSEDGSRKQHGTKKCREQLDFIADHARGKIAEFAFQSFLCRNFNIVSDIDLKIYQGCDNTDEGHDLEYLWMKGKLHRFNLKADIKNVGKTSQWLLIEDHKFWAEVYILSKITTTDFPGDRKFEQDPYKYKDIDWKANLKAMHFVRKSITRKNSVLGFNFIRARGYIAVGLSKT